MSEPVTREWLERTFEAVKNWGRWGPDDERGALNWLTPERRAAAARGVRDGAVVSCARELMTQAGIDNPNPAQHMMLMAGDARDGAGVPDLEASMDYLGVACHGMAVSHIDALCHVAWDGELYNGRPFASSLSAAGAT